MNAMPKPTFAEINLSRFNELNYKSLSHTFNKAVVASYYNVSRYGFEETDDYILIPQAQRNLILVKRPWKIPLKKKSLILFENAFEKATKVKEVCYDLGQI